MQLEADSKYDWLRSGVFVGSLEGEKSDKYAVCIKIYKMR